MSTDAVRAALAELVAATNPDGETSVADWRKAWAAARAALSEPVPEFCCKHSWSAAVQLAWKERDTNCNCDHNEYCGKCWPLEFREGGKWHKYAAAPSPTTPARVVMSDEQINEAQGAAYQALCREGYTGGMGSETWDLASARAVIAEYERLNGIAPQEPTP